MKSKKGLVTKEARIMFTLTILFLIMIVPFCSFVIATNNYNIDTTYFLNEYTEVDKFIEWDGSRELDTPFVHSGGVIFVNYTVLPASNANVTFIPSDWRITVWSPTLSNFTLLHGESFSETFTSQSNSTEDIDHIGFNAIVLEQDANATVRFGYNVIRESTPISLNALEIIIGFFVFSFFNLIFKRKQIEK